MRFVVGNNPDLGIQAGIDDEKRKHQDFLVLDIQEAYENLLLKVINFVAHTDCDLVPHLLKVF